MTKMASTPLFQPEFAAQDHSLQILSVLALKARERFNELGFPSRRDEDWRLTTLTPVTDHPFAKAPEATVTSEGWILPDAITITFVNDRLVGGVAENELPPGVTMTALSSAANSHPQLIENHLGRLAHFDDQPFGLGSVFILFVIIAHKNKCRRNCHDE